MKIENVAIFGGNGTIGSLVCGIVASLGKANVYLISRDKQKLNEKLLDKIYSSIKSDSIKQKIIPCDYEDAKKILNRCDWIFESVAENYEIKQSVYQVIEKFASNDAIITTGTSGLSIHKLSEIFSTEKRKNFFGTHFFNPPYHMTLCEIIPTQYTNIQIIEQFTKYLEEVLLRTTIISKDKPAFIANRIGFKLINDLLLMAEEYKGDGGINYIDSVFTGYTGRNMPPLTTLDFVGLDIHKAIVDNIYMQTEDEFRESFKLSDWFIKQIEKGNLGRKVGKGLYKENDVLDISKGIYMPKESYKWTEIQEIEELIKDGEYVQAYKKLFDCSTKEKEIVVKTLVEYIVYSLYVSKFTADKIEECDDAMGTGFGWCPPIALKELLDEVCNFKELCAKYIGNDIMQKYELYDIIDKIPKSKYDYRKYIKAV